MQTPAAIPVKTRKRIFDHRHPIGIYWFILPAVGLFFLFSVYPVLDSLVMSFTDWPLIGQAHFVGFKNYAHIAQDPYIGTALRNVIYYGAVSVPLQLVLGLVAALALDRPLRGRAAFRVLFYLPVITSWVVVSVLFEYLFNTDYGLVNWLLTSLHLTSQGIAWLAGPRSAILMLAILGTWKGIGWTMMIFLAGLQSISADLYEAAAIDGANRWQQFRNVTVPGLRNSTLFITVMLTVGAFNVFLSVFIITGGGPGHSTEVLLSRLYNAAFSDMNFGYASALSYFTTALIVIVSLLQFWLLPSRREKEV